jgi:hypothetical protein
MRCGRPVEIGGFRWKPEEIHSYKFDYSANRSGSCQEWRSRVKAAVHLTLVQEPSVRAGARFHAISGRISLNIAVRSEVEQNQLVAVVE